MVATNVSANVEIQMELRLGMKKMNMNERDLAAFRERLLDLRDTLKGSVSDLAESAASSTEATASSKVPVDDADNAADAYAQHFAFLGMESEEKLLRKVEGALVRIKEGAFGECLDCGKSIGHDRLDALPFADRCVACQAKNESRERNQAEDDFELLDEAAELEDDES
jgi:RNA polymerase-binding protein DksA